MNLSAFFIHRPIATILLTIGFFLGCGLTFFLLPVSQLPTVDLPVISVSASQRGASPEVMSTSVATPLERHLRTIAGVNEMTSSSSAGSTRVTLQFDLGRNIDDLARQVQAAINASYGDLPASVKPTYRKVNPAEQPMLLLALTSDKMAPGQMYDSASNILQQKLSQVKGVGQVDIQGSSLPAVRVYLNPRILYKYGIATSDVRTALSAANANTPLGVVDQGTQGLQIYLNSTTSNAEQYRNLIIAYRNGSAVRLKDVADVTDGVADDKTMGMFNGKPAILVIISRQPGANIISTVENVKNELPELSAALGSNIKLSIALDRTATIHASIQDVEFTLLISIALVMLVVYLFLRNFRAALIPSVAVPLSLAGCCAFMYMVGFSLDTLSLMAMTVATGFVVDDAIVVLENVTRHMENGMPRKEATLRGAREVGFTVVSMSFSLIAVFLPILRYPGLVGQYFYEFAAVLSCAILVSLLVSLTTTPMLCANLDLKINQGRQNFLLRGSEWLFEKSKAFYGRTLDWALDNPGLVMFVLLVTIAMNGYLYTIVPKGFFPQQDSGQLQGQASGDQTASFALMKPKIIEVLQKIAKDPGIQNVVAYSGGGGGRGGGGFSGQVFAQLKPLSERNNMSTDEVNTRIRASVADVAGVRAFLSVPQDIRYGARGGQGNYQYALQADDISVMNEWAPKITDALSNLPQLEDVNADRQANGQEIDLNVDRGTASRLGISMSQVNSTLADAFSQNSVATIQTEQNQYSVIMSVAQQFWQTPDTLKELYIAKSGGPISGSAATASVTTPAPGSTSDPAAAADAAAAAQAVQNQAANALLSTGRGAASTGSAVSTRQVAMIPLSEVASYGPGLAPLSINHDGGFVSTTISFGLPLGTPLGDAVKAINQTMVDLHAPISIHGEFAGTAQLFNSSAGDVPILILTAVVAVYIVLGILYESYVHPLTIISTLPSAGVGALLAILAFKNQEFGMISMIGVILLIGIVKKNAIMMVDFALEAERREGLEAREAIHQAGMLRFRPIMMTSFAAVLGAVPLAIGIGTGWEMRQPLGIAIVGGLVVSQILTLYTTPVVYMYIDRWRVSAKRAWERWYHGVMGDEGTIEVAAE